MLTYLVFSTKMSAATFTESRHIAQLVKRRDNSAETCRSYVKILHINYTIEHLLVLHEISTTPPSGTLPFLSERVFQFIALVRP